MPGGLKKCCKALGSGSGLSLIFFRIIQPASHAGTALLLQCCKHGANLRRPNIENKGEKS